MAKRRIPKYDPAEGGYLLRLEARQGRRWVESGTYDDSYPTFRQACRDARIILRRRRKRRGVELAPAQGDRLCVTSRFTTRRLWCTRPHP